MADRQIILIPFWIQETLRRHQLPLATCLDLRKMRTFASLEDLAGMLTFNELGSYMESLTGMRDSTLGGLFWTWASSIPSDQPDLKEWFETILSPLSQDPSTRAAVFGRLFTPEQACARHTEPFITYDLSPECAGVVINSGFFGTTVDAKLQLSLVEAMLQALYVYQPTNKVAQNPLFKRWLELLSV